MNSMNGKKYQQLRSIEIARQSVSELAAALGNYLVLSKGHGWKDGELEFACGEALDACFARIRNLRKIVKMNYSGVAANGIEFSMACDEKKVADLSKAFKRARQHEIDEGAV